MKKALILTFVIIVVLSVGFFVLYTQEKGNGGSNTTDDNITFPVSTDGDNDASTTGNTSTGSSTSDNGTQGGDVKVDIDKVLMRKETIDIGGGSYILAGGNDTKINSPYQIVYYKPDNSYIVSLLSTPIRTVRMDAEVVFLSILGLSKEDACKLKVLVATPMDVSESFGGRNLGLSFCYGSEGLFE